MRRIVDEAYENVTRLLTEHRDKLDSLTARLLELETLDMDDAYEAAGVPVPRGTDSTAESTVVARLRKPLS